MEKLTYSIDDGTIAQILGRDNFTNEYSAILELVKNSYDAGAKKVVIDFDMQNEKSIIVSDDGHGMSEDDIRTNWMYVGKSNKEYLIANLAEKRIYAGSKGIGRFALARLGAKIEIISKKENEATIKLFSDWTETLIDIVDDKVPVGTKIFISGLRDRWSESNIEKLLYFLSCAYNSNQMQIVLNYNNKSVQVERILQNLKKGVNYVSKVSLNFNSEELKLYIDINSDEFLDQVQNKVIGTNIKNQKYIIDIKKEEYKNNISDDKNKEQLQVFESIGNFTGELYFSLSTITSEDMEKFKYKHKMLKNRLKSDVILYRNAFSISSYEGKKDWLDLNQRSRKSPAAASHETGSWRVRSNQLSGSIEIDKINNNLLRDLSNRQGLEENEQYEAFKRVIHLGLEKFESYRQEIIRTLVKGNKESTKGEEKIYKLFIKNPKVLDQLTSEEKLTFNLEIKELVESSEDRVYDVRILNVLATSGLKATSIAHELKNERSNIESSYENIVDSLKSYGMWEVLNESEKTKLKHKNVPAMLTECNEISQKIVAFMDVLLTDTEKRHFSPAEVDIRKYIFAIANKWETDYKDISIEIIGDESESILILKDTISVILDNLILNSIQQNNGEVNIFIKYEVDSDCIRFYYKDDGIGLNEKYIDNPERILKVHETSKENGHGLGMWIVNNTILLTDGKIDKIYSKDGFGFDFSVGIKNVEW